MAKSNMIPIGEISEVKVTHNITLANEDDPRALINIVPEKVGLAIRNVVSNYPEHVAANERNLREMVKPSPTDDKLRLLFWREYNRAQDTRTNMKMVNVYAPIMTQENWDRIVRNSPTRLAWIISPPEEYMISLEASLNNGRENVDKILSMNLFNKDGTLKLAEAKIFSAIYLATQNRVKGAVVTQIEQRTASIHKTIKDNDMDDDVQKELDKLRKQQETTTIEITKYKEESDSE